MNYMQARKMGYSIGDSLKVDWEQTRNDFRKMKPLVANMRRPVVSDTFSGITFSIGVGMANELLIAGLTFEQSLKSRLMSIPANAVFSRPYGMYRDWIYKITKTKADSGQLKKFFVDLGTFITGQITFYAGILALSGANLKQIAVACTSVTVMSPFMGRAMGAWYDLIRTKLFHLPPAGSTETEKKE
ncbi:MAG: L-alanine exporter AlaE [Candidatus Micrarchaeota archaeon]